MKKNIENLLELIASAELDIETLETQNSDDKDFHEVSVWSLKKALLAAYEAGAKSAKSTNKKV